MALDIGGGLADQEAAAVLPLLVGLLRGHGLVETFGHRTEGLVDIRHLGGLQQEPGHAQADGLLGILEVPIAGEHDDLHVRILAFEARQHGQPVVPGHADVREQDVGLELADDRRAAHRIRSRGDDLAAIVRPLDHFFEPLDDEPFIVDQHDPIHLMLPSLQRQ